MISLTHLAGIINVGANVSHGSLRSPLFSDRTFEFVPIPEGYVDGLPRYSSFRCMSNRAAGDFLPHSYLDQAMHNDPEFQTFTYGDSPEENSRASNLKKLAKGDSLFFLARLVELNEEGRWGQATLNLVGELVLDRVIRKTDLVAHPNLAGPVKGNAHVMRWTLNPYLEPHNFWVFVGSEKSSRFNHAVPFDGEMMTRVLRKADGSPIEKPRDKTDLWFVGTNTRACRIIEDAERIGVLQSHIEMHR